MYNNNLNLSHLFLNKTLSPTLSYYLPIFEKLKEQQNKISGVEKEKKYCDKIIYYLINLCQDISFLDTGTINYIQDLIINNKYYDQIINELGNLLIKKEKLKL